MWKWIKKKNKTNSSCYLIQLNLINWIKKRKKSSFPSELMWNQFFSSVRKWHIVRLYWFRNELNFAREILTSLNRIKKEKKLWFFSNENWDLHSRWRHHLKLYHRKIAFVCLFWHKKKIVVRINVNMAEVGIDFWIHTDFIFFPF